MSSPLREILAFFEITVSDESLKKSAAQVTAFQKNLKKTGEKVSDFSKTLQNLGQAALGGEIVKSFGEMITGSLEMGSRINDLSEKLGVGTDELQQFQYAAKLTGVDGESAAQALGFLNKAMGESLVAGSPQAKMFSDMHVAVKNADGSVRELSDVIPELADSFAAMGSDQERTAKAMQIFGKSGAALLPLLKQGGKGLEEMNAKFKELGLGLDRDFIKAADDAGDQIDTLKLQFTVLKTKLVAEALPAIKTITDFLLKLGAGAMKLAKNTNIMVVAMGAMAAVTGVAGVGALSKLGKALGLAGEEGLLLAGEVLIWIAGFVALALVVEDLYTLFTGGDSVIGRFIDSLFGIGASQDLIEELSYTFGLLWDQIKVFGPPLMELGAVLMQAFRDSLPYLKEFAATYLPFLVRNFVLLINVVRLFVDGMGTMASVAAVVWGNIFDQIRTAVDIMTFFYNLVMKVVGAISSIKMPNLPGLGTAAASAGGGPGLLGSAASLLPSGLTGGGGGQANVTQDNKTTINVNGAGDPQAVANGVSGSLSDTFAKTSRDAYAAVASIF